MKFILPLLLLLPVICNAEVMDKMPSLLSTLVIMVIGSVTSYLSARYKTWLLIVVLPIFGFLTLPSLFDVADPFMAAAIANESTAAYSFISWFSPVLILICTCLGLFIKVRHAKIKQA